MRSNKLKEVPRCVVHFALHKFRCLLLHFVSTNLEPPLWQDLEPGQLSGH